jgi:hypothetical protein
MTSSRYALLNIIVCVYVARAMSLLYILLLYHAEQAFGTAVTMVYNCCRCRCAALYSNVVTASHATAALYKLPLTRTLNICTSEVY